MTYPIPPSTRAIGTGNPPGDMNDVAALLALILGTTPGSNVTAGAVTLAASTVTVSVSTGTTTIPLSVIGSSDAGATASFQQTGTTDHALTAYLNSTGGTTNSAINAVSGNSAFSAVEVTGTETAHGTVKITHLGYAAGSDANAAAISIDLQTTVGGSTGTDAQGLFITSTTDAIPGGNAINVRYDTLDWFVVKGGASGTGQGIVGIGVPVSHIPLGMLEIAQKDTTSYGLYMEAIASGTDMIHLLDSGGTLRFQVNNGGALVLRGSGLFDNNVIIGSVSNDAGGAGSALTICHSTDPSTNPASGHIILYTDVSGNLKARGSSGTVTTIAGP